MTLQYPFRSRSAALAALLALALIPLSPGVAQAQEVPTGVWQGTIEAPGEAVDIIVTLRAGADGVLSGTIDIPLQNLSDFPLSDVALADGSLTFALASAVVFTSSWDAAAQTISGEAAQGGGTVPFSLTRTGDAPELAPAETIDPALAAMVSGDWQGNINAGGQVLPIVFHISVDADGALTATMDSPAQGQNGLPVDTVAFDGSMLRIELNYAGAFFEGTINADATAVEGNWNQGGAAMPLTIEKQ